VIFLTDMDEICALAQISGVQEPLGTLNGWSCLGRFLANFFIVMNATCPKIFTNILRTTLRSRSDFACLMLHQSWCCIVANIVANACVYHGLVGSAWLVMDLWGTPQGITRNVSD